MDGEPLGALTLTITLALTPSPHRHRHPNASLGPSLSLSPSPKQESRVAHFHCLNDLGEAIPVHVKSHIPNANPKA